MGEDEQEMGSIGGAEARNADGGREKLVTEVVAALADGRSVVLAGEAGIGKTTVARVAVGAFADGRVIRWGQGVSPLDWIPYLPLARAVGRRLEGESTSVADRVLSRIGGGILVIDDVQWADRDMLEILRIGGDRAPVLACLRSTDERGADVAVAVG